MNNFKNQNQSSHFCYYPESINLNVETMTVTKPTEKHKEESPPQKAQNSSNGFSFDNLFGNLNNSPLSAFLGGKSSLADILKFGGIEQAKNLSQIMSLLSANNKNSDSKNKENKKEENIIDVEASFEEL